MAKQTTAPLAPTAHVVSPAAVAAIAAKPEILLHSSVVLCQPGFPYSRDKDYVTKTMVVHQKTTIVSGSTYKCSTCGETLTGS